MPLCCGSLVVIIIIIIVVIVIIISTSACAKDTLSGMSAPAALLELKETKRSCGGGIYQCKLFTHHYVELFRGLIRCLKGPYSQVVNIRSVLVVEGYPLDLEVGGRSLPRAPP